jgi:hypothetical protein
MPRLRERLLELDATLRAGVAQGRLELGASCARVTRRLQETQRRRDSVVAGACNARGWQAADRSTAARFGVGCLLHRILPISTAGMEAI